jgi:hypothetical protein
MQPRDETAQQQALRRAVELIEAHGGEVTIPESVGCEGHIFEAYMPLPNGCASARCIRCGHVPTTTYSVGCESIG